MAPGTMSDITYNDQKNTTTYTSAPYGSLSFPGKWAMGKYNKSSRHQYFYHPDTSTLIAAIGPCKGLPSAKDNAQGYEVVRKYYDLETRFQALNNIELKPLVEDEANRYMIWAARVDGIDQYFLFGLKDCACNECVYRYMVLKTRKMSEEAKVSFLRETFLAKD
jgi:hypothetical protein